MKKVYSVANGKINEYKLIKETNCFFNIINNDGLKDKISKYGNLLPVRLGGKSTSTTDILKAATAAQDQINIINGHIEKEKSKMVEAESELKAFHSKYESAFEF